MPIDWTLPIIAIHVITERPMSTGSRFGILQKSEEFCCECESTITIGITDVAVSRADLNTDSILLKKVKRDLLARGRGARGRIGKFCTVVSIGPQNAPWVNAIYGTDSTSDGLPISQHSQCCSIHCLWVQYKCPDWRALSHLLQCRLCFQGYSKGRLRAFSLNWNSGNT